jgi:hypothetical protein
MTSAQSSSRPHPTDRVALFAPAGFPTVDAPAIARAVLDQALAGLPVDAAESPAARPEPDPPQQNPLHVHPQRNPIPHQPMAA